MGELLSAALAPLVIVAGPTGSGKSDLAIRLAKEFSGEVVNCDSLQVYRRFDIGTAKLPEADRGGIPHHLIDVADGEESFTAGDFARAARRTVREISERGSLPIVAGGTGFYLRALLDGLPAAPERDDALRERLRAREIRRPGSLHRILRRLDRSSSERIHPHDVSKVIRALEIRLLRARSPAGARRGDALEGYRVLKLGLFPPRAELYQALDRRCKAIFEGGLLLEIEAILDSGVAPTAKPLQSLGYKEGLAFLQGKILRNEAIAGMQRDTRRYAKRQITWFRHEPGILPLLGFGNDPAIQNEAGEHVNRLLK